MATPVTSKEFPEIWGQDYSAQDYGVLWGGSSASDQPPQELEPEGGSNPHVIWGASDMSDYQGSSSSVPDHWKEVVRETKLRALKQFEDRSNDATPGAQGANDATDDENAAGSTNFCWSTGSLGHEVGTCKPCHYISRKKSCANGADCTFCHLPHTKATKSRPCKSKRERLRLQAALVSLGGQEEAPSGETASGETNPNKMSL